MAAATWRRGVLSQRRRESGRGRGAGQRAQRVLSFSLLPAERSAAASWSASSSSYRRRRRHGKRRAAGVEGSSPPARLRAFLAPRDPLPPAPPWQYTGRKVRTRTQVATCSARGWLVLACAMLQAPAKDRPACGASRRQLAGNVSMGRAASAPCRHYSCGAAMLATSIMAALRIRYSSSTARRGGAPSPPPPPSRRAPTAKGRPRHHILAPATLAPRVRGKRTVESMPPRRTLRAPPPPSPDTVPSSCATLFAVGNDRRPDALPLHFTCWTRPLPRCPSPRAPHSQPCSASRAQSGSSQSCG